MAICPIDNDFRLWMEQAYLWLIQEFDEEKIKARNIFLPTPADFPFVYDGSEKSVTDTVTIVANAMEINPDDIQLDFFNEGLQELNSGTGYSIFTEQDENEENAAGRYFGKNENGKYEVAVDTELFK